MYERYRQTTDRQTTDGRAIAYSEREREFTFAKNYAVYSHDKAMMSDQIILYNTVGKMLTRMKFDTLKAVVPC